jgi:DNA-binding transcriptional ArsR family regulator
VDVAPVAALIGDPGRARVLSPCLRREVPPALTDGRALPASVLVSEAGVSASTASAHLAKLVDGGLLTVESHGRHRYYRLAGPHVAVAIEALAAIALRTEVRSLRQGNRAQALRAARTCYDHLAGRLGVALMRTLLARGVVAGADGADGRFDPARPGRDRLSAPGRDVDYRPTGAGEAFLADLGVRIPEGRRPLVRYCVDWSDQAHHLAGRLGAALLTHALEAGWLTRTPTRAVRLTPKGRDALTALGVPLDTP